MSTTFPELIGFPEQTVVYAENQPQYRPLPAHRTPDGVVTCCWRLGWRDRLRVLWTGRLWHQISTFNDPLQPQLLLTRKPELTFGDREE